MGVGETPSLRARALRLAVRVTMRRDEWGDEAALVRRARRRDRGIVLFMHGGGYVSCSPATHRPMAAGIARHTGRRVFSLDYRLAPEHPFPAALDDAVAAYQRLLAIGIEPATVAFAGDSAGGGLVLATLLRLRDVSISLPAHGVCFSPWTDLAGTGASLLGNDGACPTFRPRNIPDFARVYLGAQSPTNPYASPVFGVLRGLPPLLFQVSSNELLLDDSRRVHDAVLAAGGASTIEVYADLFHGWQMMDRFMPEARLALRRVAAFLDEETS